jgi:hypothetical protein
VKTKNTIIHHIEIANFLLLLIVRKIMGVIPETKNIEHPIRMASTSPENRLIFLTKNNRNTNEKKIEVMAMKELYLIILLVAKILFNLLLS